MRWQIFLGNKQKKGPVSWNYTRGVGKMYRLLAQLQKLVENELIKCSSGRQTCLGVTIASYSENSWKMHLSAATRLRSLQNRIPKQVGSPIRDAPNQWRIHPIFPRSQIYFWAAISWKIGHLLNSTNDERIQLMAQPPARSPQIMPGAELGWK